MRSRVLALCFSALLLGSTASAKPSDDVKPKAFDIVGILANLTVDHAGITLPANQVPYLRAGDVIHISFPKQVQFSSAPRWHLVVADIYADEHKEPTFPIADADLSAGKPGQVWSVTDDGAATPVIFLVPENGTKYGHGVPQARAEIASPDDREQFVQAALFSANAAAKASALDSFMASLKASDASLATDDAARVDAASASLFGSSPGSEACFTSGIANATEYACAASAVAADYQTPNDVRIAATLGSQLAVDAAPYGVLMGAVYQIIAKRHVGAKYQFVPGALKPTDGPADVYVQDPLQYDSSGSKPSSVLYFQIGSQGNGAKEPAFGDAPPLPACLPRSPLQVAVPFTGLPVYFRSHSISLTTSSGTFSVPATYDAATGYNAQLTADQVKAMAGGATARVISVWGFDSFESPPIEIVEPRSAAWKLDSSRDDAIAGDKTLSLSFSDGASAMGACVTGVDVHDGLGHPIAVTSLARVRDGVTIGLDMTNAREGGGGATVVEAGDLRSNELPFTVLPALPAITRATAYLPDGPLVLEGANLKYIDTVTLTGTNVTFGNGTPTFGQDGAWEFTLTGAHRYDPAWEHETMTIHYTLEPPDDRTDAAEVDVEYVPPRSAATATPQPSSASPTPMPPVR